MPKLNITRVLLRDGSGGTYRPLSFACELDAAKSEPYFKVLFPDLKGKTIYSDQVPDTKRAREHLIDPAVATLMPTGADEITYHYDSGILHYKASGKAVKEWRGLPCLGNYGFIHLCRFTIHDLSQFAVRPVNNDTGTDMVLEHPFVGAPRIFNLYLISSDKVVELVNTDPQTRLLSVKRVSGLKDAKAELLVADYELLPPYPPETGYSIFTYDDPTTPLRPPSG